MTAAKARSLLFGHYDVTNRKVERALMLIGRDADVLHKFHIEGDKTNREGEASCGESWSARFRWSERTTSPASAPFTVQVMHVSIPFVGIVRSFRMQLGVRTEE